MNELKAIYQAFLENQRLGQRSALATIVHTSGSTYRRAGARMLISEDGRAAGSISGGCLEADVIERARPVMSSGKPVMVGYDTRSDEDLIWGLGLGCQGVVELMIESLSAEPGGNKYIDFLGRCGYAREAGVSATVVGAAAGAQDAQIGDRLMLSADGVEYSGTLGIDLALQMEADALAALDSGKSEIKIYGASDTAVKVFIEVIEPPVPLLIFGAGPDALPVVRFAKELGWRVTVVDTRARAATLERFHDADEVVLCRSGNINEHVEIGPRTVAVVMTHNYLDDLDLLEQLGPSPARYVGVLGPRKRTEKLLDEMPERCGLGARLRSPVGIDIGADTPEEIALSIVAEVKAVLAGRPGAFLKDRRASIHPSRVEENSVVGESARLRANDVTSPARERTRAA
jgi:xanthine/CO dehydrogenase XdhC/CoxF family maturation factor